MHVAKGTAVLGLSAEELFDSFQDFLDGYAPPPRRSRRKVSVREARRILAQQEEDRLVDWDTVIESAVRRVEQAGVVFIDELDKTVGGEGEYSGEVSGEGVQRDLLPIVEGSVVMTRYGPVRTDHILFIAAGAFHVAKPSDLIPELQGRFPIRVELEPLTREDFVRILGEPQNALVRQYVELLRTEGMTLRFGDDAVAAIAEIASEVNQRTENIGARRLYTVMEKLLEEISFTAPDRVGTELLVDAEYVHARLADVLKDEDLSRYIL